MAARLRLFSLSLSCFSILVACRLAPAADNPVTVKASVEKTRLSIDEQITFKIEITGDLKGNANLELPNLQQNFDIISTAQSQSLSMQGRERNRQINFIYVLAAKTTGKFTIGEVTIKIGKDILKTPSIEVEITPSINLRTEVPETPPETELKPDEEFPREGVIL